MPEGHTIHRLARQQQMLFGGQVVRASSPQGRFTEGAQILDGRLLKRTEAFGKHLFHHYAGAPTLHVHLGLYGNFATGTGEPPEPRGALRLRLQSDDAWTDLRGATACELIEADEMTALLARLGSDPLRSGTDPMATYERISRSRVVVAALLMDQQVIAGVGNVYRAELLFRHGIDPFLPGRSLPAPVWSAMWSDLVSLMQAGVRSGRIVTVRAQDRVRKRGPLNRLDANYVYRRSGLPCRVCGTEIRTEVLVGRNLFWCPCCQAPGSPG